MSILALVTGRGGAPLASLCHGVAACRDDPSGERFHSNRMGLKQAPVRRCGIRQCRCRRRVQRSPTTRTTRTEVREALASAEEQEEEEAGDKPRMPSTATSGSHEKAKMSLLKTRHVKQHSTGRRGVLLLLLLLLRWLVLQVSVDGVDERLAHLSKVDLCWNQRRGVHRSAKWSLSGEEAA